MLMWVVKITSFLEACASSGESSQWRELARAHSTDTAVSSAFGSYARLEYSLAVGIRNTLKTRDISAALCFAAGLGGSQDTITAALANGLPLHKALCAGAARSGRRELLQWLRYEQLCPWSVESIAMSVCDDVEMLKYLWSKEPWTKNAYYICNAAARKGCFAALKWMASANCLWDVFDELTTEVRNIVMHYHSSNCDNITESSSFACATSSRTYNRYRTSVC
jgi:hypothetical protein